MRALKRLTRIPRLALVSLPVAVCLVVLIFAQSRQPGTEQQRSRRVGAANARTITVRAGSNLQSAIDAAQPGDTLLVEAGATFNGPFTLPDKGNSTEWITIRTSASDSALPAAGERISPVDSALLPKILSPGGAPALQTAAGAHHYRLIGLEFKSPDSAPLVYDLVQLGDGSSAQNRLEKVPHHLLLDRCLINASVRQLMKRGVAMNSAETTVVGCYISGFKMEGQDSQAIACWNGPGPFHILNNYLEAAGENLMFGGAQPSIPGLVPSDIEVRRNYLFKPLSWRQGEASYAGVRYSVKNLFELKSARRVIVEGNVMENCWGDVNWGYGAVNLTVRGDSGSWATVEDVEIRSNIVRHTPNGLNILGKDTDAASSQGRSVKVENNFFEDVDGGRWGGDGEFVKVSNMEGVEIRHNTVMQTGNIITVYGVASSGFVLTDNVVKHNNYGIIGVNQGVGRGSLNVYMPGAVVRRNVIVGADFSAYPTDNFFPTKLSKVGFVDLERGDYRLRAESPYRKRATDGRDVGCDFDALSAATAGVVKRPGS